jgi:hypothetical protein
MPQAQSSAQAAASDRDADLLARYRREPRVIRETVSVKITRPTLDRLDAFILATQAQRQTVWEDALLALLEKVGF